MTIPEPNSVADAKPLAAIEAVERGLASQGYIASRQIATINPLGFRTSTIYDPTGAIVASIDPLARRTSSIYDLASR